MRLQYPNGRYLPVFLELDDAPAVGPETVAHIVILLNVQLPKCPPPPPSLPAAEPNTVYFSFWRSIWQVRQRSTPLQPLASVCCRLTPARLQRCSYRVCADGGANALFDSFSRRVALLHALAFHWHSRELKDHS